MINRLKASCFVCGRIFEYVGGDYHPKTCSTFECVQKYNHNPDRYQSLNERIDNCRIQAKI